MTLKVSGIDFEYGHHPLLRNIDFTLHQGELMHLQGANGGGKTTLLKLIAGLLRPEQGHCELSTISSTLSPWEYFNRITFIGHAIGLNPALTLRENYLSQALVTAEVLDNTIKAAELLSFSAHGVGLLSAGQKRRAALLRLELENTLLWLLDEPFVALDTNASARLSLVIQHHLSNGGMVILTSHQTLPGNLTPHQEYNLCAITS